LDYVRTIFFDFNADFASILISTVFE